MKQKQPTTFLVIIVMTIVFISVLLVHCSKRNSNTEVKEDKISAVNQNDSLAFGDTKWISDGLKGKVYVLPENTNKLPVFDTMKASATLYTHTLNVPTRSWENGFPGVSNLFEWFGIEYKGNFRVKKPGHYTFRIVSDDGSKLFIDNKLVVDNDGLHPTSSASGEADIDGSEHTITVQYYQGPRYYIALQLFASIDKEEEQIFPGDNFILTTPGNSNTIWYISLTVLLVVLVVGYQYKKRKHIV
jgi:hypothetical protein